jgi:hypothetical protein
MKKIMALLMGGTLLFSACNKNDIATNSDGLTNDVPALATAHRHCASEEVFQEQVKSNPALQQRRQEIEEFTERFMKNQQAGRLLPNGIIEIPVVFNVIYRTATENISQAQLQSQIDVLNEDFSATNADYNNTPATFTGVRAGDTRIRFVLDQVNRRSTTRTSWLANDAMKFAANGGIDAVSPTTKLNFWVVGRLVNSANQTLLGYAQFPGGPTATDGVVQGHNYTGRTGTLSAPFNRGRTGTHEVGHWLNLRHIWGDATCGSDLVGDTPTHNAPNFGCQPLGHRSTCTGTPIEMTMNYMDYSDDVCMYMFSAGQNSRMQATFAVGGPRNSFAQP